MPQLCHAGSAGKLPKVFSLSFFEGWEHSEARPERRAQLPQAHVVSEVCLWALHSRVDCVSAVGLNLDPKLRDTYSLSLQPHVTGRRAVLEVRTTSTSIGAGGANWDVVDRNSLVVRESAHPGQHCRIGQWQRQPMRATTSAFQWPVPWRQCVVDHGGRLLFLPGSLRLALALVLTLAWSRL